MCFSLTLCFLMGSSLKFDVPFIKTLALSDRVGKALQGLQTISSCLSSSVSHRNSTSHFSSYLRRRWLWSYSLECSRLWLSLSFRFSAGFFTPGICFHIVNRVKRQQAMAIIKLSWIWSTTTSNDMNDSCQNRRGVTQNSRLMIDLGLNNLYPSWAHLLFREKGESRWLILTSIIHAPHDNKQEFCSGKRARSVRFFWYYRLWVTMIVWIFGACYDFYFS